MGGKHCFINFKVTYSGPARTKFCHQQQIWQQVVCQLSGACGCAGGRCVPGKRQGGGRDGGAPAPARRPVRGQQRRHELRGRRQGRARARPRPHHRHGEVRGLWRMFLGLGQ